MLEALPVLDTGVIPALGAPVRLSTGDATVTLFGDLRRARVLPAWDPRIFWYCSALVLCLASAAVRASVMILFLASWSMSSPLLAVTFSVYSLSASVRASVTHC